MSEVFFGEVFMGGGRVCVLTTCNVARSEVYLFVNNNN